MGFEKGARLIYYSGGMLERYANLMSCQVIGMIINLVRDPVTRLVSDFTQITYNRKEKVNIILLAF